MKRAYLILMFLGLMPFSAIAAKSADIDRLTIYSTIMGRAVACGESIEANSKKVGAWIDRTFYGKQRAAMSATFAYGLEYSASAQRDGGSPDSCVTVRRAYKNTTWP